MDYQSFKKDYEQSGLTQKAYSQKKGISASMVCYYLRRAREQDVSQPQLPNPNEALFSKLELSGSTNKIIKITLSSGVTIEVPV